MYKIGKQDFSSIFGFITIGLMLGHIGPLLSAASAELGIEAGVVGNTIALFYGVSVLGILAGFFLIKRLGKEWFLMGGSLLLILAYGMGLMIKTPWDLFLVTVFLGLGMGVYQIGVNSLAVDRISTFPLRQQSGRLAFMQFFFGVGAVSSPLLVDLSQSWLGNWRYSFPMILVLGPLLAAAILTVDLKRLRNLKKRSADNGCAESLNTKEFHRIQWSGVLIMMLILVCLYTSLETSVFNWLSYYWGQGHAESSLLTGARVSAVFWLGFCISRLMMGWFVVKFGEWRAMISFSSIILSLIILWWLMNPPWSVLLGMVVIISLMMGCMFPTIVMVISRLQPGDSSQVVGLLFVLATASASLVPVGIGKAIKSYDISVFPLSLAALGISFLILLLTLYWKNYRRQ